VAVLEPGLRQRIRDSIRRQTLLTTMGVEIVEIASGRVALDLPFRADLCQQNGYLHAGAVTAVVDSACGYAAICSGEVTAHDGNGQPRLVALMQATMMAVPPSA
jgi:acyl-coenzyme A thioesterase PaaI-like protein